jgi:hypothetical protein
MKSRIILLLAAMIIMSAAIAQGKKGKFFTGKITYQVQIDGDDIPAEAKAMLPKVMNYYIGTSHTKSELFTQMGNQSSIENLEEKTKINLLEIMGQKFAFEDTPEDLEKEWAEIPKTEIEFTGETKNIAGYNCKQVIAKKKSDGEIFSTGWFTEDIQTPENINYFNPVFRQVKGLFLEYDMEASAGMKMIFTAIKVEKAKMKDATFQIPEGFSILSREELQQMFGG